MSYKIKPMTIGMIRRRTNKFSELRKKFFEEAHSHDISAIYDSGRDR